MYLLVAGVENVPVINSVNDNYGSLTAVYNDFFLFTEFSGVENVTVTNPFKDNYDNLTSSYDGFYSQSYLELKILV